jgi:hypothetical protein
MTTATIGIVLVARFATTTAGIAMATMMGRAEDQFGLGDAARHPLEQLCGRLDQRPREEKAHSSPAPPHDRLPCLLEEEQGRGKAQEE